MTQRRLATLVDALAQLARPQCGDADALVMDAVLRAAVERWLQVSVEAAVDIADHVIAERGWTPPDSGRASFVTLASHGLIDAELAKRLGDAVGLRNLLVHQYASVNLEIVAKIVREELHDLRSFASTAASWITV